MKTIRPMYALLAAAVAVALICSAAVLFDPTPAFAWAADHHQYLAEPLAALFARRVTLVGEMKALLDKAEEENRDLTAEEQAAYDGLKAEKVTLDKRIERAQEVAAAEEQMNAVQPAAARRGGPMPIPPGPSARREFENFGEFMSSVRFNHNDPRLTFVEGVGSAEVEGSEIHAEMRMDNNPSGGFMVPHQFRSNIMQVQPQEALVRPRASVIEAGTPPDAGVTMPALDQTGTAPGNMFGGVEVQWIGEGEDKPETDAKLREVTLTPHEVAGFVTITDKLLRNWQASAAFIEQLLRGGIAQAEDYAFLRGNGVHKPLGVIESDAAYKVNRTTANQVKYADLVNMVARLLMRGGSPVWSAPQSVLPQIATMKDENNNLIWVENARDGFAGTLLGYPLRWNNRAPALGSKGDLVLGEYSNYLIKDGSGPFVAASEHVLFKSNKTIIKIFYNVDGAPWLTAPIKEENGYEVSPFVVLDVPA
ncbi:phage major capsid protein [Hyphomonas sp.]|uniref:phage major capsid protein n=1 Tax=Hyphomonas sp. TaxID=87 RepID=UPI000A72275C|nr:phage major capsid protein [Hyphomonas sp.]